MKTFFTAYKGFTIELNPKTKKSISSYVVYRDGKEVFPITFSSMKKAMEAIDIWIDVGADTEEFLDTMLHPETNKKLNFLERIQEWLIGKLQH